MSGTAKYRSRGLVEVAAPDRRGLPASVAYDIKQPASRRPG